MVNLKKTLKKKFFFFQVKKWMVKKSTKEAIFNLPLKKKKTLEK